jgi:hypothetical protein
MKHGKDGKFFSTGAVQQYDNFTIHGGVNTHSLQADEALKGWTVHFHQCCRFLMEICRRGLGTSRPATSKLANFTVTSLIAARL